jgi:hypothetical protein
MKTRSRVMTNVMKRLKKHQIRVAIAHGPGLEPQAEAAAEVRVGTTEARIGVDDNARRPSRSQGQTATIAATRSTGAANVLAMTRIPRE